MNKILNIIVCASGGGGNFEKLISAQKEGFFKIVKLICDRPCGAIEKAERNMIKSVLIDRTAMSKDAFHQALELELKGDVDLIVLAGFLPIIPEQICLKYEGKIINTHPSLLPKYGGKGMYGVKVQEAVMANKEKFAGCTVHYVNSVIDGGEIILQKQIAVDYDETPWELGGRVFNEEGKLLLEAIKIIWDKKIKQQI